jgi:hypothetical protein
MKGMGPAKGTVFLETQLIRRLPFVLGRGIIPILALFASKCNDVPHSYLHQVRIS